MNDWRLSMGKKVVFLGSWHKVIFMQGERIPGKGETVSGDSYFVTAGGKGGNQACACGLLGGNAVLIQNLGDDVTGREALKIFKNCKVNTQYTKLIMGESTGLAPIMLDKNGENAIMVIPGAHGNYKTSDIDDAEDAFKDAYMACFVLESNLDATFYAIRKAHSMGVKVFLDPAPVTPLPDDIYKCLTWIKPNEHEATLLSGINVVDFETAKKAARWFMTKGVKNVLITLGGEGSILVTPEITKTFPAPKVKVVDTTTAGDIFAGTFLFALAEDMSLEDSVILATCAGSLAVTRSGAIESAAQYDELIKFFKEFKVTLR